MSNLAYNGRTLVNEQMADFISFTTTIEFDIKLSPYLFGEHMENNTETMILNYYDLFAYNIAVLNMTTVISKQLLLQLNHNIY